MRKILRPTLLVTLLATQASMFAITSAHAEESIQPAEPEIVIRNEDNKTFYEYRVNGVLKEIKVVPKIGPTYYLVPQDGNAWIREDRSQVLVPSWVLFEWQHFPLNVLLAKPNNLFALIPLLSMNILIYQRIVGGELRICGN